LSTKGVDFGWERGGTRPRLIVILLGSEHINFFARSINVSIIVVGVVKKMYSFKK
jgi:hypothetical protein